MVLPAVPYSLAFFDSMSSLMKLLHPGGACTKAEMQEYLSFALELRRTSMRQPHKNQIPSGLKPKFFPRLYGTAEAVPLQRQAGRRPLSRKPLS